jgi:hypothetical protein
LRRTAAAIFATAPAIGSISRITTGATMDQETKNAFASMLETLREVADCAFEAKEMASKNFIALQAQPGYQEAYQSQKDDLLEQLQGSRQKILARLAAELRRLETPTSPR